MNSCRGFVPHPRECLNSRPELACFAAFQVAPNDLNSDKNKFFHNALIKLKLIANFEMSVVHMNSFFHLFKCFHP